MNTWLSRVAAQPRIRDAISHIQTLALLAVVARAHTPTLGRLRQDKGSTRPAWATLENFLKVKRQDKACIK